MDITEVDQTHIRTIIILIQAPRILMDMDIIEVITIQPGHTLVVGIHHPIMTPIII